MHLTGTLGAKNMCMLWYDEELSTLPAPYETLVLAFVDDEPAGCVLLKPIKGLDDSPTGEKACELKRLWVRPQFRGLGIGRTLTDTAMAEAKRRSYTAMYLDTVPSVMQAAHRMYQELGFEPIERYNDNPVSDVNFFRRTL
jgi:putative acetyltransferase